MYRGNSPHLLDWMLESRENHGSRIGLWKEPNQMLFWGHADDPNGMNRQEFVQEQYRVPLGVADCHMRMW